jgi:CHAT domain
LWCWLPTNFIVGGAHAAQCELSSDVREHQELDDRLARKFDHYWYGTRASNSFRPLPLREILARLPARTALLFYRLSTDSVNEFPIGEIEARGIPQKLPPKFLCVWLLDARGIVAEVQTDLASFDQSRLLTLEHEIRSSLKRGDSSRGWIAAEPAKLVMATGEHPDAGTDQQAWSVLEEAGRLLLPMRVRTAILLRRYDTLVIVPSRNLGSIPFAALPVSQNFQLIDFVSLIVMPSFDALRQRRRFPENLRRGLVVGDPELTREDHLVRRNMFGSLKGAREEAQLVAGILGVTPLIGKDASQRAVLQRVAQSDLIYFATHGVADDQNPNDRSYLVLSDGALTARKIARLNLRANGSSPFVIMSACQSGLGKAFDSGVIGLTKAWRYAGAGDVVMTLWNVYDEPTRDLMVDFVRRLKEREAPAEALRGAMLEARGNRKARHPVYWAGFAVYGSPLDW